LDGTTLNSVSTKPAAGQNDEWAVQRARYITLEPVAPLSDDLLVSLPSVVAA